MTTPPRVSRFLLAALLVCPVATAQVGTLKGRVVNPLGVGVAGVTVDVRPAGVRVRTGLGGSFSIAVRFGTYDVRLRPPTPSLAPREIRGVRVGFSTDLGTIKLQAGHTLSGVVRTAAGSPVAGADINVYDQATRVKLYTPGDLTGPTGAFQVVVPAGTYRVRAQADPVKLLVAREVHGVVVKAATSVGVITLLPGVRVTGTVVDAGSGAPLADVDLDADDAISGQRIVTPNDNTNAQGRFSMIVPRGLMHFAVDPPRGDLHLGRRIFNVSVTASMDLGRVALGRGIPISGTVLGPGGAPVVDADLNVVTVPGKRKVYTPNDKTDRAGKFTVVVPGGRYTVVVRPHARDGLVGARTAPITVMAATTLPAFRLARGVVVSGTLRASDGSPEYGADLDFLDPVSGAELVTPGDDTDGAGRYAAVVPVGTWDVVIHTRKGSLSRLTTIKGVAVKGARTLDHRLARVPVFAYLETRGIPTVGQGGPLPVVLAFWNPNSTAARTRASLVIVDPDGGETPLLAPLTFSMPAQSFAVAPVPLPLLPVKSAHLGKVFRAELRFDDPVTGAEQDHDQVRFIVR